jgi:radical SAM protein
MNPRSVDTTERPVVLIWELTQACELACKHCRADATPNRHPEELTTTEGKQLLDSARTFSDNQLVVLSGGDPLARDDVKDLVAYGTDIGLRMTLTPSGTSSLTPSRVQALADAGLRRLAVSIDGGSAATHDAFRGESGSFEQTREAITAAKAAGLPVQINTTVCAETVDELPAIRDLVADVGAVLWSVFFLVPVGRGRVLTPISPKRAETVMKWLHTVSTEASFGIKTTEAPHYRRVAATNASAATPPPQATDTVDRERGVTAGNGFAFVSHRGEVYPSGFLPQSAGSVRETDIVEIYRESDLFRSLRQPDALGGKCGACEYQHICGGSRSRAFAYTGDPLAADPLCAYVPAAYDGPLPAHPMADRTESEVDS